MTSERPARSFSRRAILVTFATVMLVAGALVALPHPWPPSSDVRAPEPLAGADLDADLELEAPDEEVDRVALDPSGAQVASIRAIRVAAGSIDVDLRSYRGPAPVRRESSEEQEAPAWLEAGQRPGAIPGLPGRAAEAAVVATGNSVAPPDGNVGGVIGTPAGPSRLFMGLDWAGWGCGRPADPSGDVGPAHYVQAVNCSIGIFDKASGVRLAATTLNGLAAASGPATGTVCDANNEGDPIVVYDTFGDRWIVSDFAFTRDPATGKANSATYQCVFVSKTADPLGGWFLYPIRTSDSSGDLADYPKVGIWRDGVYFTFNLFGPSGFKNVRFLALNRPAIESGAAATAFIGDLPQVAGTTVFSALPATSRLQTGEPPAGRPALLSTIWGSAAVRTWSISIPDWSTPTRATVTGPVSVALPTFTAGPATAATPAVANDTLSPRLMMQSQYANLAAGESILFAHTIANPAKTTLATVRWYQVGLSEGTVARLARTGTVSPDVSVGRYMPSLAMDAAGGLAVGYSASSTTTYPQLRIASWSSGDPSGSAGGGERVLMYAGGAQDVTSQWGDYSQMSLDPDGCTFWYTGELYTAVGRDWQTGIAAFSLPSCTGTPSPAAPAPAQTLASASDGGTAISDPGAVRLTWTPPVVLPVVGPVSGYRIERSTGTGWIAIGSASDGTTWRDVSVLAATTYAYRIFAFNQGGESTTSPLTTIRTGPAPVAPTTLAFTSASATSVTVGWKDNSLNEYGFEVQLATVSTGPWYRYYVGPNVTTFTKDGLKAATTYYLRVRAIREFPSVWTTTAAAKTTR